MTKNDDRRAEIVEQLADFVLARGLSAASLRPLAQAAGLSDRMLLYYFKDKRELIEATLALIAARLVALIETRKAPHPLPVDALAATLSAILSQDELWPYIRVWTELISLAARDEPPFRDLAEAIGRGFLAWGESQLLSDDPARRAADAARVLVMVEGRMVLKAVGMSDVVALTD